MQAKLLQKLLDTIGETESLKILQPYWEESENCFPEKGPPFLHPSAFVVSREYGGFDTDVDQLLDKTAQRIRENEALLHLAWHCYRLVFEHSDYLNEKTREWPTLVKTLRDQSGIFYLLIALAAIPKILTFHALMGIPEKITRDTCSDIRIHAERYRYLNNGKWGMPVGSLYWFRFHAKGELYRLGRLQYMVNSCRGNNFCVYRNKETAKVLALAENNIRFNGEGYYDGIAGIMDTKNGWTSQLIIEKDTITGYPVSPFGMAIKKKVTLSLNKWKCVLGPDDSVLAIHIPAGGNMTLENCRDSMQNALDFFPRYFPERFFVSFRCNSWIMNTQFEQILPPTANIVRLQKEVYLYPLPSTGKDGIFFIFGKNDIDISTAPRDTKLHRAILDHLAAGNHLRSGGMFFFKQDFNHFGSQYYRSQWQNL